MYNNRYYTTYLTINYFLHLIDTKINDIRKNVSSKVGNKRQVYIYTLKTTPRF